MRWLPLWLLPQLVWAQTFLLAWQFPRDYQPQPTAFVLTYTGADGQHLDQMRTSPSAAGACAQVPGSGPNTYCTQWPVCPPAGVMTFWLQAEWDTATTSECSDPLLLCLFTAEKPCQCQDPGTFTPPTGLQTVQVPTLPAGEIPPITKVEIPAPPPFAPNFPPTPT